MPRFRTLSEALSHRIREAHLMPEVPIAGTLALQMGQGFPTDPPTDPAGGVLRWGFSTWGIEPVTGDSFPDSVE